MASLAAQSDPRCTITVIDDASTDDSVAYLRGQWPLIKLICHETNRGFATACNTGLRAADTPFLILLNNDTHVDSDWLAEGLRAFDAPEVGAVASLVLLAEPPHLIDTAGDVYSVAGGAVKRNHLRPRDTAVRLDRDVFSPCGASAFYRREAIAAAGGIDERFESYYEDVDLGFRLAWAGYRCVFAPASICYHHLSSSYDPAGWRYHFNSARNAEIVWWSNMPTRFRRKYLLAHLCFLAAQGANKLRQGRFLAYIAGKWAALRHVAHIREKRARNECLTGVAERSGSPSPTRRRGGAPRLPEDVYNNRRTEARIESLLVRDWWKLHVRSRMG